MGPTTVSELMAAKRPHLVPISEGYAADALLSRSTGRWRWWEPWQALLQGSEAQIWSTRPRRSGMLWGGL
jgi:hypothetical protein